MARTAGDIYDEILVVRCQRGDRDAWDELVRRFNDRLWYYLRRLADDDDSASQLLQDVWVLVLRGLGSLRQTDRLSPWLYTIARRVVLNHYRARYASADQMADAPVEQILDDEPDVVAQFDNAELVHFGLRRLGWVEREVLTLFFLQDLSVDEIADVLKVAPGTVKSRLSRARRELREVVEREARSELKEGPSHVP